MSGLGVTIGLDFSFLKNKGLIPIEIKLPNHLPGHYGWVRHFKKFSSQIAKTFFNRLSLEI
ncbi:hypothetical protein [Bacillus sp. AFS053548]|uniref:hypothetical protein n=1 Tax=Bacillus sp. AFS053548 TaxID=2033505 RepID=UPI000BFCCAED|nr:hypothetical protein [Bacillus sp. AFS053548]PGM49109.1 hypothetical protein CN946_22205 [Bacillus sp. AFS053548]